MTVAEHDGHSDSFQVKFPNVFTNYPLGAVRVKDQRFKDWDHYKFTLWQSQLNFVVFCASSACGVSVEHLNAKEPMITSIYRFHVYYHIRRILNNTKRSHTQLDSRKQVIAFQDRVMTINIKEAQHPLKREKQVMDKSSIMLKISTKSMHQVLV